MRCACLFSAVIPCLCLTNAIRSCIRMLQTLSAYHTPMGLACLTRDCQTNHVWLQNASTGWRESTLSFHHAARGQVWILMRIGRSFYELRRLQRETGPSNGGTFGDALVWSTRSKNNREAMPLRWYFGELAEV